jgi:tol-pal system protein YbgF
MSFVRSFAAALIAAPFFLFCPGPFPLSGLGPLTLMGVAQAQDYDRPPAAIGGDDPGRGDQGPGPGAGMDPDPGALSVRVDKLESRLREMTGQIEELQNANRKLVQQLQKFQDDVDTRLSSGRPRRAEQTPEPKPSEDASVAPDTPSTAPARKSRRNDAYDPSAAGADDPGKPKPLGSPASAQPDDSGAPMDLTGGRLRSANGGDTLAPTLQLPSSTPKPVPNVVPSDTPPAVAPTSPRAIFDQALSLYKSKQYDEAEKGFAAFIEKNPKSRLVADATYFLGESFAQRGRSREAAEQYLKVSTDYATSTRAPDAMLHLGMSLRALGAKEQACATFGEVIRKYPNAPAYVKSGVERESKRAQCS